MTKHWPDPNDVTAHYKGLALDKLGKSQKDAITSDIKDKPPTQIPTRRSILNASVWDIDARNFKGVLKIESIDNKGRFFGTVEFFGQKVDPIDGQYNSDLQMVIFKRHISSNSFQSYTGQIDAATLNMKGSFTQSDRGGEHQWSATPQQQDKKYSDEQKDSPTNNKNIKLLKYINSRDGYEISYPSGVEIVLGGVDLTITDKNEEWKFVVDTCCSDSKNLEQHVNEIIQEGKDNGYTFLDKEPSTVAGQPAIMINSLSEDTDKGKLKYTQIVMHANDMAYEFALSAPEDKFDQYASILFTILKSVKLLDQ